MFSLAWRSVTKTLISDFWYPARGDRRHIDRWQVLTGEVTDTGGGFMTHVVGRVAHWPSVDGSPHSLMCVWWCVCTCVCMCLCVCVCVCLCVCMCVCAYARVDLCVILMLYTILHACIPWHVFLRRDTFSGHPSCTVDLTIKPTWYVNYLWQWGPIKWVMWGHVTNSASMTKTQHFRLHHNGSVMLSLRHYSSHDHLIGSHCIE